MGLLSSSPSAPLPLKPASLDLCMRAVPSPQSVLLRLELIPTAEEVTRDKREGVVVLPSLLELCPTAIH